MGFDILIFFLRLSKCRFVVDASSFKHCTHQFWHIFSNSGTFGLCFKIESGAMYTQSPKVKIVEVQIFGHN